jgi:uncharacterized RDD family membrane protein YckC
MENKKFTVTNDLLATRNQRILNFIIDTISVYIIVISLATTIVIIADITNSYNLSNRIESASALEKCIFSLLVLITYYALTEIYFYRTIAKYFTKTVVIMRDGTKPKPNTIIKRTLFRLIPFEIISFFKTIPRGCHDSFSETYVVQKEKTELKKGVLYG